MSAHSAHHHGTEETQAYATVLERMNRFQEPEARAAIAGLQLPNGSRGLDVGCGVGVYALARSFQERRQRTCESILAAGVTDDCSSAQPCVHRIHRTMS